MNDVIIFVGNNCQRCSMLKAMLGELVIYCTFENAESNMDLCRKWGIKQIPAMVVKPKLGGEPQVIFDLGDIVTEVERRTSCTWQDSKELKKS